jgi:hypothetical protein
MVGKTLTIETLRQAAELAHDAVSPINDIRASANTVGSLAGNMLFVYFGMQIVSTSDKLFSREFLILNLVFLQHRQQRLYFFQFTNTCNLSEYPKDGQGLS